LTSVLGIELSFVGCATNDYSSCHVAIRQAVPVELLPATGKMLATCAASGSQGASQEAGVSRAEYGYN
jgi:hypothetical protein